jgi:hypothetical protein
MAEFIIIPAIVFGILVGLIELTFLSQDESGMHWLKHGLHAIPIMILFTFIAFNITWALSLFKIQDNLMIDIGARVFIGIIAMVKVKAAASITGRGGVGESPTHVIIIGILMMGGPFIWDYVLKTPIQKLVPWIK